MQSLTMTPSDIKMAIDEGFQGVAMLSGFWERSEHASAVVEECYRGLASAHVGI